MKELITILEIQIRECDEMDQPAHEVDWDEQTGVIISRAQAEMVVNILKTIKE